MTNVRNCLSFRNFVWLLWCCYVWVQTDTGSEPAVFWMDPMNVLQALDKAWDMDLACRPKGLKGEVWFYGEIGDQRVVKCLGVGKNQTPRLDDGLPVKVTLLQAEWEVVPFPGSFKPRRSRSASFELSERPTRLSDFLGE